jgi:hypothetical protein
VILHIGGASTGAVLVTVTAIFFLIFAMSFAIGPVPEGKRRFSSEWFAAWARASTPRFLVAGAFAILLFAGSAASGGGSNRDETCDAPLVPFTGQELSEGRMTSAVTTFGDIAANAHAGDAEGARSLFFATDAHNFTHDVSPALFYADRDLSRALCQAVIDIEEEVAVSRLDPARVAAAADRIVAALQAARETLDLSASPSPIGGASPACAQPIGAVTMDPLTEARILAASEQMRETADRAASGDAAAAGAAFAGDAHNITHDIDGPLRQADAQIAVALCESVLAIEIELGGGQDVAVIAEEAERSADLLEDAGRALGIIE